jgi:hypothetical protein
MLEDDKINSFYLKNKIILLADSLILLKRKSILLPFSLFFFAELFCCQNLSTKLESIPQVFSRRLFIF